MNFSIESLELHPPSPARHYVVQADALGCTNALRKIRGQLLEVPNVEGIYTLAIRFPSTADVQCVINPAPDPSFFGAISNRFPIHLRCNRDDLKIRENICVQEIPGFRRIDGWVEWRTREHRISLREPVAADVALDSFSLTDSKATMDWL